MSFRFLQTRVEIVAGASWPEADGLLLPTNDYLWMATGPALRVKKEAGEEVEIEAVRAGPVPVGEIVQTGAGALGYSGILHAAVMGQDLHLDPEGAAQAIRRGIGLAEERRWKRLAIHSFLGSGRGTRRDVARPILGALVDELLEGKKLEEVILLALDDDEKGVLHDTLLQIIQSHA